MKGCAVMRWSVAAGRCEASSRQHSATKAWKADVSVRERCDSISDSEDCDLEVIDYVCNMSANLIWTLGRFLGQTQLGHPFSKTINHLASEI